MFLWWTVGCDHTPSPVDGDDDDDVIAHSAETTPPPPGTTPAPFSGVAWELDPAHGTLVHVAWTQAEEATVHLSFEGGGAEGRSPDRVLAAGDHEEFVVGVPYDALVTFRLHAATAGGEVVTGDFSVRTAEVPSTLDVPSRVVDDGSDPAVPWVLVSLSGPGGGLGDPWWAMIVDRGGRVVWAQVADRERITMHPRLTWDGARLLLDQNSFWPGFDHGWGSTIRRTSLEGREVVEWPAPGLHHPFAPLPDGDVVFGALSDNHRDEELVRIDFATGARTTLWSCQEDWLADLDLEPQYCTSNTINYDAVSDTFLFSFYSFETIVEIDGTSRQTRRWFGHLPGSYRFDPVDTAFWWQHGGHFLPNGHLITSTHVAESEDEIVVREYEVDAASRTVRQVYSMGVGDGMWGVEWNQMGEVTRLPNGNTLHNMGTYPRLREGTPDGRIVWDLEFPIDNDIGRSTPVTDLYALLAPRQ